MEPSLWGPALWQGIYNYRESNNEKDRLERESLLQKQIEGDVAWLKANVWSRCYFVGKQRVGSDSYEKWNAWAMEKKPAGAESMSRFLKDERQHMELVLDWSKREWEAYWIQRALTANGLPLEIVEMVLDHVVD